jgi:hypothetical protein
MNGLLLSGLSATFLFVILQHYWTLFAGTAKRSRGNNT